MSHAGKTALDTIELLPLVGALKYADEAGALIKGGVKNSDEIIGASKTLVNPKQYSTAFEMKLDPSDFGKSRSVHFNRANAALDDAMIADPQFAKMMDDLMPGARGAVSKTGGRQSPTNWSWEHASTSTASGQKGVMRLVPTEQHTPGSQWWRILHPDSGARGGYSEWAIPAGAPKN